MAPEKGARVAFNNLAFGDVGLDYSLFQAGGKNRQGGTGTLQELVLCELGLSLCIGFGFRPGT